ncbi:MAG: DUF6807 family protein, partial [Planctomycetota bacterium]
MVRAFDDPEDRIRFEAVQAAWQSRHTGFAGWLVGVCADETDRLTWYSAWNALADLASVESRRYLLTVDERPRVRLATLLGFLRDGSIEGDELLTLATRDSDGDVQEMALRYLVQATPLSWRGKKPVEGGVLRAGELLSRAESGEQRIRTRLFQMLSQTGVRGEVWERARTIYEAERRIDDRVSLLRALSEEPKKAAELCWEALKSSSSDLREAALDGLKRGGSGVLSFVLTEIETSTHPRQLRAAVEWLEATKARGWKLTSRAASLLSAGQRAFGGPSDHAALLRVWSSADVSSWDDRRTRAFALDLVQLALSSDDNRLHVAGADLAALLGVSAEVMGDSRRVTVDDVTSRLTDGNAERGRTIFFDTQRANCIGCHRVGDQGAIFAPDLSDVGLRSKAADLARSVLEPSAVITEGFRAYTVVTKKGQVHEGMVLRETRRELSLVPVSGETVTIEKRQIASRTTTERSAMPDNFGSLLSGDEVIDLVAFLSSLRDREVGLTRGAEPETSASRRVQFERQNGELRILVGGSRFASYVFEDPKTLRPFLAGVQLGGFPVTRNHPPIPGVDVADHGTMHPGIWLAFGDISGNDFWRNRARVVHERFSVPPVGGKSGRFAVINRYVAGEKTVCIQ